VLAVTAKASSAAAAARLANAFASQTVALRTGRFHHAVDQQIAGLKAQIAVTSERILRIDFQLRINLPGLAGRSVADAEGWSAAGHEHLGSGFAA
jgi:hypothetical protein